MRGTLGRHIKRLYAQVTAMRRSGNPHAYRHSLPESAAEQTMRYALLMAWIGLACLSAALWALAWQPLTLNTLPPAPQPPINPRPQHADMATPTDRGLPAQAAGTFPSVTDPNTQLADILHRPSLFTPIAQTVAAEKHAQAKPSDTGTSDPGLAPSGHPVPMQATPPRWQIRLSTLAPSARQQIQALLHEAQVAEQAEQWAAASAAYIAVLQQDAHAVSAMAGLIRVAQRQGKQALADATLTRLRLELPQIAPEALEAAP